MALFIMTIYTCIGIHIYLCNIMTLVIQGKNMSLGRFIQMARNTASHHQKELSLSTEETEVGRSN